VIPAILKRRIPDSVERVYYMRYPEGTTPEQMARFSLKYINALARDGSRDPLVRQVAEQIVAGVNRRDQLAVITAVHNWVQRRFKYEFDPGDIEMVTHPRHAIQAALQNGRYDEDCDGFVVTEAAILAYLLGSTRRVRFVILKADKRAPDQWSHIFMQAKARGKWITLDPIMQGEHPKRPKHPVGWHPPKYYAKRNVELGSGPSLPDLAASDKMPFYEREGRMGKWIPGQRGRSARGNAIAYEDDTWFDRLPFLPDDPRADPRDNVGLGPSGNVAGLGAVMNYDYAQRHLVKGGALEAAEGISGFGAILSNAYDQQFGVPGYRPTTTGEDPQTAAGTPYWEAPGTVGGAMRSQYAKTGAVSGVADYIQLGAAEPQGDWESVAANLLQTSTQIAAGAQLTQINRDRMKAGLPPISPTAGGAVTPTRAGAFGIGTLALVGIGALAVWAIMRKRRKNPRRRRRNPGSTLGAGRPLPPERKKVKVKRGIKRIMRMGHSKAAATRIYNKQVRAAKKRAEERKTMGI
jgi:hypothetical protein